MDPELWSSRKQKSAVLDPDRVVGFVFFVGFARSNPQRNQGKSPILDLIQSLQSAEELVDQVKRPILDIYMALQEGRRRAIAPDRGENALQRRLPARTWSQRRCIMSEVMPRRRKINIRAGRVAARERVRELVGEHAAGASDKLQRRYQV